MNAHSPVNFESKNYDVASIRKDFPILSKQVHGKPLVYLDNGASAQKPQQVIDAITKAYSDEYSNVHRGLHYLSNVATDNYENARNTVKDFLNAKSTDEIIFTRSSTEAINLVSYSWGVDNISAGDEIIVSIMEHHSNIVPWHFLRERNKAILKWSPINEDSSFDLDSFKKLLTPKVKLVAITHMSNVTGTIVPIKEICELAHQRGILVLIDGSQAAVHMPVDVQDLDADFYVFTGHKVYGPTGIGVLYGKKDLLEKMRPFNGGGEMILDVFEDKITYNHPPHKFEAGTPSIVQAIGLASALNYIESIGRDKISNYETGLCQYAHERLSAINSLRIFGNAPGKGAIISFELIGTHSHDVSTIIDRSGVAVRAGTHCAQPLLAKFGVTSTCRASLGLYNTCEEIDILFEALQKAQDMLT